MLKNEEIISDALNNIDVINFLKKNNLSSEFVSKNSFKIDDFLNGWVKCSSGPLSECKQQTKGYKKILSYENNIMYVSTTFCEHYLFENHNYKIIKNYIYADFDLKSDLKTMGEYAKEMKGEPLENSRFNLINDFKKIINIKKGKGFFIYGKMGVGKTFLAKLIANNYAYKGLKTAFITVAKLIRTIKNDFNTTDQNGTKLLNLLTKAEVLVLDDIGADKPSIWSRDELLFSLLNYRMENKLLTFFTSNLTLSQLQKKYAFKTTDSDEQTLEKIANERFIERVKALSAPYKIDGVNWRLSEN
ncbi:ATP-binding protein [Spiroplasma endosymbiont of Labia minor]|uniref:ATP-binding protein n=1 Tax=Spiroplasma endosymbiont of Labia minor TaxID=3066305 RepID=UPI0030D5E603